MNIIFKQRKVNRIVREREGGRWRLERWSRGRDTRDGEVEKWRDREMEKWKSGEIERWRNGEMEVWDEFHIAGFLGCFLNDSSILDIQVSRSRIKLLPSLKIF